MKIYNLKTSEFLYPKESKITGSEAVIILGTHIKDLQFNTSHSRGTIRNIEKHATFENCIFQYVDFYHISKITFINCKFINCSFDGTCQISFVNCESDIKENFKNCLFEDSDISVVDSNGFCMTLFAEFKKEIEKKQKEIQDIKKGLKYGYSIVRIPVLAKIQFNQDNKFRDLDKKCSLVENPIDVIAVYPTDNKSVDISNCKYIVEREIRYYADLRFFKDENNIDKYLL